MKREITEYVDRCLTCQRVEGEHERPVGELRLLQIPTSKSDSILIDFIVGLPLTAWKKNDIWSLVDRLTKSVYFLPVCVKEIVWLHGVPKDIISDRERRFQARFREALQRAFGTKLNFSNFYHLKTNG